MGYSDAWKCLEKQLMRLVGMKKLTVAYIEGPHGCGKSTTMMLALSEAFEKESSNSRFVHIVPGPDEYPRPTGDQHISWQFLDRMRARKNPFLERNWSGDNPESVMTVLPYFQLLELHEKGKSLIDGPTIIFFDQENLPSMWGELAIALLIDMVRNAYHANDTIRIAIFVLASHRSQRTIDCFRDKFRLAKINELKIETEDTPATGVKWIVDADGQINPGHHVSQGSNVIVGGQPGGHTFRPLPHGFTEDVDGSWHGTHGQGYLMMQGLESSGGGQFYAIRHDIPWSTHVKDLAMVYAPRQVWDTVLDYHNGHLLLTRRDLTRTENGQLYSWASKSAAEFGKTVQFVATYTREELEQMPDDTDRFGSAWNRDLLFTVLQFRTIWPGFIGNIPMRHPPGGEEDLWLHTESALRYAGCVIPGQGNRLDVTKRGQYIVQLRQGGMVVVWAAAMLTARAREIAATNPASTVAHALVWLAAILENDNSDSCIQRLGNRQWPVKAERFHGCHGPASSEAYAGSLWYTFGLYCRDDIPMGPDQWWKIPGGKLRLFNSPVTDVRNRAGNLLMHAGMDMGRLSVTWNSVGKSMGREDREVIQIALAEAFMYQFLRVAGKDSAATGQEDIHARDCQSNQVVKLARYDLAIEFERIWASNPLGFYVFYSGPLVMDEDGSLRAEKVTYIPTMILVRLAGRFSRNWPGIIRRMHWGMS